MRSFLLITLFICLTTIALARPSRLDDRSDTSEVEENEYEANEEENAAEDNVQENEDSRLSDQEAGDTAADEESRNQQPMRFGREKYPQRNYMEEADRPRANADGFSECNRGRGKGEKFEETIQANNELPSFSKRRQTNRYIDNSDVNDPPEKVQHLTNNYKTNRVQGDSRNNEYDKRTIDSQTSSLDDSDAIFDNNRENRNSGEKVEYNNEVADSSEQSRHFKQYYNTMQSEHKSMLGDKNYEMGNRDRRQAEASNNINLSSTSTEKEMISAEISNEEDEAAIRRHIKKLSGEELEELLNSLSDDKKALLNRIIDNDRNAYDTVNKREITKKAGAVEENNYIDSGMSEISKVQGGSPSIDINTESAVSQSADLENTKQESQTESVDISTKTADTTRAETPESRAELLSEPNDAATNSKLDSSAYDTNDASSSVQSTKTENKRETNVDYFKNPDGSFDDTQISDNYFNTKDGDDSFNDQGHFCSQDVDLSQLIDEEAQLHNNEHQYKREIQDNSVDVDDSMKSLEESFPNSNCEENGQYFESNMAPLVRVKRKDDDLVIKKRAAAVLPDAKVAFFPYKAENDDVDTDEGSEFEDDGFYDRTSNYAKNDANKPGDNTDTKYGVRSVQSKANVEEDSKPEDSANDKVESDTMSLGSDTDSVLSGVEGVDDNLMFNSGSRNRRTAEDPEGIDQGRPLRSTPSPEENAKLPDSFINVPNYQESDAFGSLPRNYEGELGRYKRIRRVKPPALSDATA
ncbi:uncharacterized protein DDB_G0290685-like [Ostrinia furnacalis]|uniref:uncharacterized protein DDB_G0290685-like n=1 Tax=Ostrinia furnacalis TaxID=93504 RepID=UPI00103DB51D|nr:uncharacterized protein DDB_G0290685-like [Ostrinia furnacalis]